MRIQGMDVELLRVRTVVAGSGCAGLNAADWLYDMGERDFVLLTEDMRAGTSRNAGSDKQTYYKLSLAGDEGDSVGQLARTLYGAGAHGDIALCEAAGSAESFFKLARLGVPFPCNAFGEYVGYRTDHDPRGRATSAGPLTSRYMAEALEASVRAKGVRVLDGCLAFHLLKDEEDGIAGVLCHRKTDGRFLLIACAHVVLCTGGPAHIYADSVYPLGHTGMSGMALAAGATGANLHHWQYGLASTRFRWNVSGSYQQVLPRYVSVDESGAEREFLMEALDPTDAARRSFLKGYEWPFDVRKTAGSSAVDLLVFAECRKGRRVYLDFRRNPSYLERGLDCLPDEVAAYLKKSGATQDTPIGRLSHMNAPAVALYRGQGIDLAGEMLEIRVCAQHHNGGVAVDADWQSSLPGLYAAGEAAGTFGAYRPGGSALNSGQVGAMRAARHIAERSRRRPPDEATVERLLRAQWPMLVKGGPSAMRGRAQRAMSGCGAFLREPEALKAHLREMEHWLSHREPLCGMSAEILWDRLKLGDLLITQAAVADAMLASADRDGSWGAALIVDGRGDPMNVLPGLRVRPASGHDKNSIAETKYGGGRFYTVFADARPLPDRDLWFETVWKAFDERKLSQ